MADDNWEEKKKIYVGANEEAKKRNPIREFLIIILSGQTVIMLMCNLYVRAHEHPVIVDNSDYLMEKRMTVGQTLS